VPLFITVDGAEAATTRFFCSSEEAVEIVAGIASRGEAALNEVTKPMIASGTCVFLAEPKRPVSFSVKRLGKTFGTDHKLTVVEFFVEIHDGLSYRFYALLPAGQARVEGARNT
jgi:hypothetical protein